MNFASASCKIHKASFLDFLHNSSFDMNRVQRALEEINGMEIDSGMLRNHFQIANLLVWAA
jgi:hypothetical protein